MHGPHTEDAHQHLADALKALSLAIESGEMHTEALRLVRLLTAAQEELRRLSRKDEQWRMDQPAGVGADAQFSSRVSSDPAFPET